MSDLANELGVHRSLASKFRSGTEFPKIAHLERLAQWSGEKEIVLAAIAYLEMFEPLRRSVATWIALQQPGHLDFPHLDTAIRDDQIRRRLADSGLLGEGDTIPDNAVVAVADGHGVSAVTGWINVHGGSRLRATESDGSDLDGTGLRVLARTMLTGVDPHAPVFHVPSPSWTDLYVSVYRADPSRSLTSVGQQLVNGVALQVVLAAILAFHRSLMQPTQLWPLDISSEFAAASGRAPEAELTEAQHEQLSALDDRSVWAVIVDDDGVGRAVADRVLRSRSATPLTGTPSSLPAALRLLAAAEDQPPGTWKSAAQWFPNPQAVTNGSPMLVDLALGRKGDTGLARAAMRRLLGLLVPTTGAPTAWYLVGTEAQVRSAAAGITTPVNAISVCRPDRFPTPSSSARTVSVRERMLPDITRSSIQDVATYIDWWQLEEHLGTLGINALVEFPPGQGGSAAARAVMSWRSDLDELSHGGQQFVSLDEMLRTDDAARLLKVHGFSDAWERAHADRAVAAPFIRTSPATADRARAAEEVSRAVLRSSARALRSGVDSAGAGAVYLDLTATPFGRVPAAKRNWNVTESLTDAYRTVAARVFAAYAEHPLVFVFAARGALDRDQFSPLDWQHLEVPELTREQLVPILSRHGLTLPPKTPSRLAASIATWEWSSTGHDADGST